MGLLSNPQQRGPTQDSGWSVAFRFKLSDSLLAVTLRACTAQLSFWLDTDPCTLSMTAFFDIFVDSFFLVRSAPPPFFTRSAAPSPDRLGESELGF